MTNQHKKFLLFLSQRFVYWLHDVVDDGIGPTPPPTRPDHVGCGMKATPGKIGKIVGGDEADPNEWPWQISVQADGSIYVVVPVN